VKPLSDGGYAVLVRSGIVLLDATLAKRGEILGDHGLDRLAVLPGEQRFVVYDEGRRPYEGSVGGVLAKVEAMEGLTDALAVTERGYIAIGAKEIVVDVDGVKTKLAIDGRMDQGGCAWRGGAVIAGGAGIAILAADGSVLAQADVAARGKPVALPEAIAVRTDDGITLFDGEARAITAIPVAADFVACGAGVLSFHDEDRRASVVTCWEGSDARWERTFPHALEKLNVLGAFVVIAHDKTVWILDRTTGEDLAKLALGEVDYMDSFADGVAFSVSDQADVLWWRRDHDIVRLSHDVDAGDIWSVPAGLVSNEASVLYLWRPDVPGPEWTPVSTAIPMNTPIIADGVPVRVLAAGRFALRAERLDRKEACRVDPNGPWRPLITRDDATRIVERLVARTFDGPLPSGEGNALLNLPPVQTVDLHGKAMFAASTLDEAQRANSMLTRNRFFNELGLALGASGRSLLAAVRARKMTLVPPRALPGYEYLGSFTTSGALEVSDPCYVGRKGGGGGFSLSLKVAGHEGVWHVFVRSVEGRTAELVTVHEDGFEAYATESEGSIGVDSGSAGVFDKKCPKRDPNYALEEGTFAALGAIASTGWGDGAYPVYVGKVKGRVAKIRIYYIGDDPEVDRTVAKSKATTAKPYSASAKFALGDTVEHVKFGAGSVIRVGSDGKIDVRFSDGTRTLVHGKK
jgi:hypothetical protein